MYSFIGSGINCGTQLFINWGGGLLVPQIIGVFVK
jgi:hypothetical protein